MLRRQFNSLTTRSNISSRFPCIGPVSSLAIGFSKHKSLPWSGLHNQSGSSGHTPNILCYNCIREHTLPSSTDCIMEGVHLHMIINDRPLAACIASAAGSYKASHSVPQSYWSSTGHPGAVLGLLQSGLAYNYGCLTRHTLLHFSVAVCEQCASILVSRSDVYCLTTIDILGHLFLSACFPFKDSFRSSFSEPGVVVHTYSRCTWGQASGSFKANRVRVPSFRSARAI